MSVPTDEEKATFAESGYRVQPISGPLTLSSIEAVDESAETGELRGRADRQAAAPANLFWFSSDFVYYLLALVSDPFVANDVALQIILTRLRLGSVHAAAGPPRSVRLRNAVIPAGVTLPMAVGRVAELPFWLFGGGVGSPVRSGATRVALQYLVRYADIEPYLLARSLHRIELRPGTDSARRLRSAPAA